MRALLDVNVLIALLDAEHVHHAAARRWLTKNIAFGWATCPITQNGCLRVMAHPAYPNQVAASAVAQRLRDAAATDHHRFWPDNFSLLTPGSIDWDRAIGHKQITDLYLLALAATHGGRLVTFDTRVAHWAVPTASSSSYCVI